MSSVDILPTLVARVPGLRARVRPWLDQATGRDVLVQEAPVAPVFGQFPANRRVPGSSIVDGKWRLILENERAALFDLELDPHELLDVAGDHPDVVAALRAELAAAQARQRARGAALGAGREAALPGDRRAGLEGLGYAGAEEDDE
jgi:arylsulfatase A-like enzyme